MNSENEFVLKRQLKLHELLRKRSKNYTLGRISQELSDTCSIVSCKPDTIRKDISKFRSCGAQIQEERRPCGKVFYYEDPNQPFPVKIWNGNEDATKRKVTDYLKKYSDNLLCAAALQWMEGHIPDLPVLEDEFDQLQMHRLIQSAMQVIPAEVTLMDDTCYKLQVQHIKLENGQWIIYGKTEENLVRIMFNEIDCVDL